MFAGSVTITVPFSTLIGVTTVHAPVTGSNARNLTIAPSAPTNAGRANAVVTSVAEPSSVGMLYTNVCTMVDPGATSCAAAAVYAVNTSFGAVTDACAGTTAPLMITLAEAGCTCCCTAAVACAAFATACAVAFASAACAAAFTSASFWAVVVDELDDFDELDDLWPELEEVVGLGAAQTDIVMDSASIREAANAKYFFTFCPPFLIR